MHVLIASLLLFPGILKLMESITGFSAQKEVLNKLLIFGIFH